MTDPWDEKPGWSSISESYPRIAMDAWLEKLKVETDKDKYYADWVKHLENFDSINFHQKAMALGMSYAEFLELKEKAEKWDASIEYMHNGNPKYERIIRALEKRIWNFEKKLEAVKKWHQIQLGNEVDPQDIYELSEILGAKA